MRKKYEKPMLFCECFKLDASIALGCTANNPDLVKAIYDSYNKNETGMDRDTYINFYLEKIDKNGYCYHVLAEGKILFTS